MLLIYYIGQLNTASTGSLSAYKTFVHDPIIFHKGFELTTRNNENNDFSREGCPNSFSDWPASSKEDESVAAEDNDVITLKLETLTWMYIWDDNDGNYYDEKPPISEIDTAMTRIHALTGKGLLSAEIEAMLLRQLFLDGTYSAKIQSLINVFQTTDGEEDMILSKVLVTLLDSI